MEEATESSNHCVITAVMIFRLDPRVELTLRKVFRKFNFHNVSGLLKFWAFSRDPNLEDIGCNLLLTDITRNPTQDQGLADYLKRCFENEYPSIGIQTSVGNWLAGRSAQTGVADHKTTHHVVEQQDQYSEDVGAKGQLVLPVYFQGVVNELVGIIEYVTPLPKESYVDDFGELRNLLEEEGLTSTYIGKTVKVVYNGNTIRFTLPLEAEFGDLHTEVVTKRFKELNNQIYRVEYNNTEGIRCLISTNDDLQVCLAESSSRGSKFIRMFVSVEQRSQSTKGLVRKSYIMANSELIQAKIH